MKTLYEPANAVEAHMLVDLLKQHGFAAHVQGEHLLSGVGELPAAGLLRLTIDDADHAAARAVIDEWNAATPPEPKAPAAVKGRAAPLMAGLVAGLLVGVVATHLFYRQAAHEGVLDHNGDGKADEWYVTASSGDVVKVDADRNFDGKVDAVTHFARGEVITQDLDDDFDGAFETHWRYRNGNTEVAEIDTDGDGLVDLRLHHRHGVMAYADHLDPKTGRPLRSEAFQRSRLMVTELDTDGDGVLDTRQTHGKSGEVVATGKIVAAVPK